MIKKKPVQSPEQLQWKTLTVSIGVKMWDDISEEKY